MKLTVNSDRTQELIRYRRLIHKHPELRYEENKTAALVTDHLKKLGINFQDKIAETGVVALIDSGKPGKTLLVRADMDALPIFEESTAEYKSVHDGVMHACGHDAHTSILMGLATEIKEDIRSILPKGKVLLVFQPAEEGGQGADRMIEQGILEKYNVDAAIALHVWNHIPVGKVGVVDGPMMAAVDEFTIRISGVSGHGAMPQHTVDPIVTGAHIVTALQTIVSRNTDPLDSCVVTVGSFHSGNAFNVIPETAELKGTVRTYSKRMFEEVPERLRRVVEGVADAFGAEVGIHYERTNRPTINEPYMADIVRKASVNILGQGSVTEENTKSMGGEDFSAFLMKVPGCYFFVGSGNETKGLIHPHHSSKFDIDEDSLSIGLSVLKEAVRLYLEEN
ncbi:amidohydrolase [Leptospira gomenensis]|uniref:Amidohydrolase n=1 Tax=Leptospira gomenensis TaxID=2484974 RepID=A0A5F1YG41_9LEPT|nr:amidohydrolase [Leptospira gomenensis]TGK39373.1 amidohydrolase [Leptospira gomenensis]TGK44067.1 amidohydrolase [Leptospira gomenensis]TGK44314.1 amidohydrolase [Leptospira gomenensis]TGK65841.1 amidohydrolase [Leptospira gomenensis]